MMSFFLFGSRRARLPKCAIRPDRFLSEQPQRSVENCTPCLQEEAVRNQNYELAGELKTEDFGNHSFV
jgi:hypothetical protein